MAKPQVRIDRDVAAKIRRIAEKSRRSFAQEVNFILSEHCRGIAANVAGGQAGERKTA
jgi:hypothetical protein